MLRTLTPAAMLIAAFSSSGCDDEPMTVAGPTTFQVRIENVSAQYDLIDSGVFNTPDGAVAPGPLLPGASYGAVFHAARGQRLHFATMFVQSNDFFFAPDGDGIALYDEQGDPVGGDVTDQVLLWDAGTEVDQEPGLGPDQAPSQAGPNTGAADPNAAVRVAADAFGNLPAVSDVIRVTLTPLGGTGFHLFITNVSDENTLQTSDGGSGPVLLAPGVYAVGSDADVLFTVGEAEPGEGLEALAEDGDPSALGGALAARTGVTTPLAPGAWAVHVDPGVLFDGGTADRGEGLEALAEDGVAGPLAATLAGAADVRSSGVFDTPEGAGGPGPLLPGSAYTFEVTAEPGDRLSFATMFVQSNDLFYGPSDAGIGLFTSGDTPLDGDVTGMVFLWDAGTEQNQYPGTGPDQAPRQDGPDTGAGEGGIVAQVNDGYTYPDVSAVIRVTVTPQG